MLDAAHMPSCSGPQPPQIDSTATRKGRASAEYTDTERCLACYVQERNRFRQLPDHKVCRRPYAIAMACIDYAFSAAEHAARSGKKTVMPKDVFDAMQELEFEFMLPRLEAEVSKFTSIQADKRNTYRKKVREEKKAAKEKVTSGDGSDDSPPTKRARRMSLDNGEHAGSEDDDDNVDETIDDVDQEDDEVEDDEVDEDVPDEGLTEDPLEEKENEPSDDEMGEGDESD